MVGAFQAGLIVKCLPKRPKSPPGDQIHTLLADLWPRNCCQYPGRASTLCLQEETARRAGKGAGSEGGKFLKEGQILKGNTEPCFTTSQGQLWYPTGLHITSRAQLGHSMRAKLVRPSLSVGKGSSIHPLLSLWIVGIRT